MACRILLVAIAFVANSLGGPQVTKGQNTGPDTTNQQSGRNGQPVPPVRVIIEEPLPTIHTEPVSASDKAEPKGESLPRFLRPDWVIVYVTAVYALIAGWTLIAIQRQANLLKQQVEDAREANARTAEIASRQADLLQASMTQWVSVANWQTTVAETTSSLSEQVKVLLIQFEIANESNFPLTMAGTVRFFGNLPNAATYLIIEQILFPRKPYSASIRAYITPEQSAELLGGALRIAVHGQIVHIGVAKEESPLMTIRGNLVCGRGIPTRLEYESISMKKMDPQSKKAEGAET